MSVIMEPQRSRCGRSRLTRRVRALALAAATALVIGLNVPSAAGRPPEFADHLPPTNSRDNVVLRWNAAALEAVISSQMGPPMVARGLAILHTCIYDAWAAYDRRAVGTQLGARLRQPPHRRTLRNKNEAISHAAYTAAVDLWPGQRAEWDALMADLGYSRAPRSSAARIGARACSAVLAVRHHDGANQLGDLADGAYSDYTEYIAENLPMDLAEPFDVSAVKDPNRWQPLTFLGSDSVPNTMAWIAPHFGRVKPFAMASWDHFRLPPPAPYGSREYRRQSDELIRKAANLTDRQKVITEYWADEGPGFVSPPGTWARVSYFVSKRDRHTVDEDAKMFFAVTNAVLDSAIAVWGWKRHYDYVRPITAIRYLYHGRQIPSWRPAGGRAALIDGSTWMPYQPTRFVTPAFAEYPSGHSAFGAAAAEVLRTFTGSDWYGGSVTIPAGSSRVEPGVSPRRDITLSWPTFSAAMAENGISRRYGGVHFRDGDLQSRRIGRKAGANAWDLAAKYFTGRPGRN